MPADMAAYMDARGLVYDTTGNDLLMDAYEWTVAIGSLENYQQTVNTKSQQILVNLQDFMGQYNSYISGANAQISQSHETLAGIARGQSMYGTAEAGLAITALVLGLVLGCVVTLGVQKLGRKRRTE